MWTRAALVLLCLAPLPLAAQDGSTLPPALADLSDLPETSSPDWLSDTVTRPHGDIATSALPPAVTVMPLGAVTIDAVGLLPAAITGLPRELWGASETETLSRLFRAQPVQGLPAIQAFTETLALAELDPPAEAAPDLPGLFLARVDGKSPVEYLTAEADRERVRRTARRLLARPVHHLAAVREAWQAELANSRAEA